MDTGVAGALGLGARWAVRMSGCCDAGGGAQAGFPREGAGRRPRGGWVGLCAPFYSTQPSSAQPPFDVRQVKTRLVGLRGAGRGGGVRTKWRAGRRLDAPPPRQPAPRGKASGRRRRFQNKEMLREARGTRPRGRRGRHGPGRLLSFQLGRANFPPPSAKAAAPGKGEEG